MLMGKKIGRGKADKMIAKGAKLYDVRDPVSFRDGTIPGATNLQLRQISTLMRYPRTDKLIFFGTGDNDANLAMTLNYVHQLGFTDVYVIDYK